MDKLHMLKINDHTVLNFIDLQETFSPWELYTQREAFAAFAQVHCCPLTTWIKGENGAMDGARYLDKAFWLALLQQEPDPLTADPMEVIRRCLEALLGAELQKEEAAGRIALEIRCLQLEEKLAHIRANARLTPEETAIAATLLAICELAETDAREQDFHRWQKEAPAAEQPSALSEQTGTPAVSDPEIADFPQVDKLVLKTRLEPYRYRYHESDRLAGSTIKTVRIEAASGNGSSLRIEFCKADGFMAQYLEMKPGEYRDCTAAGGQLIRVLPTLSISDTLCLARKDYTSTQITVIPRNAPEWLLNVDSATARKISCFAAGDNATEGFLYLRGGRLMKGFYKPNENYTIRQQLEMVEDKLVEIRLSNGRYELLTEHGEILSNDPQRSGTTGVISLYPRTAPQAKYREVAFSDSGSSYAAHEHQTDRCNVIFG